MKVTLAQRVGRSGTTITATGSPARIAGLRSGNPSRKDQYMVKRIVMRHQHNAAEEAARETQDRVRHRTPKRSRRSAFSVQFSVRREGDRVVGRVYSDYENVRRLEEGTGLYGPHRRPIVARRPGGVLRFPNRGTGAFRVTDAIRQVGGIDDPRARFTYRAAVRGQQAHHMFRDTAREMRIESPRIFRKHAHFAAQEIKARL